MARTRNPRVTLINDLRTVKRATGALIDRWMWFGRRSDNHYYRTEPSDYPEKSEQVWLTTATDLENIGAAAYRLAEWARRNAHASAAIKHDSSIAR